MPKAAVTMISLGRSQLLMLAMVVAVLLRTAEAADEDETPKCYRPDGSEADDTYRPCDKTASVSMCCHLGVGSSYNGGDACGSGPTYGLCGITGTQLWRESCTDPTWQDPACLQFCTTGDGKCRLSFVRFRIVYMLLSFYYLGSFTNQVLPYRIYYRHYDYKML